MTGLRVRTDQVAPQCVTAKLQPGSAASGPASAEAGDRAFDSMSARPFKYKFSINGWHPFPLRLIPPLRHAEPRETPSC